MDAFLSRRVLGLALFGLLACAQVPAAPPVVPGRVVGEAEAARPPASEDGGETLAISRDGKPIRMRCFGRGPRRVLWVGGIHGDEREGAHATAALGEAFLGVPGAAERVTLCVIEDLNPDGSARRRRGNARGVDLNRNFPAANFRAGEHHGREPLSEPESRALFELIVGWRPELVLVAHSWRGGQFVNFDGPARGVAERLAERAGFELRGSEALDATPGSLGSWAKEGGLALVTIEFRRGAEAKGVWEATREAILAVVVGD